AEVQAREAQIELGLERVRARAMAMQKSDELSELVDTVFKELTKLDFALTWCIINIIDESSLTNTAWAANPDIDRTPDSYHMKFEGYPFHHAMMNGWKERKVKYVYVLEGIEKKVYDEYLYNETEFRRIPEAAKAASKALEKYVVSFSFSNFGGLQTVGDVPLSDANLDILSRFGKVFDLTYTRFNDLKQAEEQARESKIQLAMERVRARTMAMQNSNELPDAANLLFQQVQSLGMPAWSAGYCIWEADKNAITAWMSSEGVIQPPFRVPLTEEATFIHMREGWEKGESFYVDEVGGEICKAHYEYMRTLPSVGKILDSIIEAGHPLPTFQIMHMAYFTQGFLLFITYEPVQHAWDIFKRFGKVFEQTYTRFLDLQKAEAQAKESQIEASLERVRSKTMAMHNSEDVADTVATMFDELVKLGVETVRCGIAIIDESKTMEVWTAKSNPGEKVSLTIGRLDMRNHPLFIAVYEAWKNKEQVVTYELIGEDLKNYFRNINNSPDYPIRYDIESLPYRQSNTAFMFPEGSLFVFSQEPLATETTQIFKRFAGVFGQTYRRYLDLQKAEAQTREAKIEAAMEKIRARAMAMQKPDELTGVAQLLRKEMGLLGVEELEGSTVFIYKENTDKAECWFAIKNKRQTNQQMIADYIPLSLNETWVGKEMLRFCNSDEKQISITMKGPHRREWIEYCSKFSPLLAEFYGDHIPDRTYHLYKFSNGAIGAAAEGAISAESWDLLKRATTVFS
ncbi:MAG: hypothetical protein ABUT20_48770, partial [Bacteroidota bacterium]